MAQSRHTKVQRRKTRRQTPRSLRTFLLLQQFEAKEIGERIAMSRTRRGLTQEELAAMASFSKRSLQDYEAGKTIPYRHFRELSRLLREREEWFLYGDTQAEPEGAAEILAELHQARDELRELQAGQDEIAERLARLEAEPLPREPRQGRDG